MASGGMRQLWRAFSTLRLSRPYEQGHFTVAPFRTFWKPPMQPLIHAPLPPLHQLEQCRTFASKVKKYKLKSYAAFKGRFKLKANGEYKRWHAGKRHNAHSKTNKQLRQLRRPAVVHSAYAKVMKKLNFTG